jgi:hypothetical protein
MRSRFATVLVALAFTLTGGGAVVASAATPVSEMNDSRMLGDWYHQGSYAYWMQCYDIGKEGVADGSWSDFKCEYDTAPGVGHGFWLLFVYVE